MEEFLFYILKVTACFTLFYICVRAFLSNETFHRFNRAVILIGTGICFALPLIKVNVREYSPIQKPFVLIEEALIPVEQSPDMAIYPYDIPALPSLSEPENPAIPVGTVLLFIYLIGSGVNLIILARSIYSMYRLIRGGRKIVQGQHIFVVISSDINPFSWGRYIILSEADYAGNSSEIITHEMAHIRHRHSLDLIYMELVVLVQWFNPAAWLLKRELKDIHEYQADISVLESGIDATKYQLLLVKKAVGASSYTLANSFNHSKIKKRITMMLKEKSNKWARLKLLLLLPLGILTVYAFARPSVNEPLNTLINYESTENLSDVKMLDKELSSSATADVDQVVSKSAIKFTPPQIKQDVPPPPPLQVTTNQQRDSVSKALNEYIDKNGYKSENRIGNPPTGKFEVMMMSDTRDLENKTTVFPRSYNKKVDGNKSGYLRIYWYVIDGKKYSWNKFMDKCRYGKVFFDRSKIKPEDGKITELYGITTDGVKTPGFYMVGCKE